MAARSIVRESAIAVCVAGLLIATTVLVYYTTGASGVATNFYYIPIIIAAVTFGDLGAVLCGLTAALLAGPIMPAYFEQDGTPVPQGPLPIVLRMLFFFIVGAVVSRLTDRARRREREVRTLFEVAKAVNSSIRLHDVLQLIVQSAHSIMGVKAVAIRLVDRRAETPGELTQAISEGLSMEYLSKGPVSVADSPVDRRVLEGETIQITDVARSSLTQYKEEILAEGVRSLLCVPLMSKDKAIGVFRIYTPNPHRYTAAELRLVSAFAEEAAVAIENADLYESLQESYYETVRSLTRALEARDEEQLGHAERVTAMVDELAHEMGLSRDEIELLRFGATLHDIGKIGTLETSEDATSGDIAMWGREGPLAHLHPVIGVSILKPVRFLEPVLPIVLHHHEKFDGSGYPEGLAGTEIPLYGRIGKIANDYDYIKRGHKGKGPMTDLEALAYFEARAGGEYDPELVAVFARLVARRVQSGADSREGVGAPVYG